MKIEVQPIEASFDMLKKCVNHCWKNNVKSFKRLYATNHSILEIPEFYITATVPRSVALQMETHKKKHGTYVWMASARPDRDEEASKNYSREQPVDLFMKVTSRGIIDISHYRMCMATEKPTRDFMFALRDKLIEIGHGDLAKHMRPICEYRNGICSELKSKSCGRFPTEEL